VVRSGTKAPPEPIGEFLRHTADRDRAGLFAVVDLQAAVYGPAEAVCPFQNRVEHWHDVAGQAVDDPQHLGGRGLLLQRLAGLSQQPRIFHRNDCLCREILQQCDLLVGKRSDF